MTWLLAIGCALLAATLWVLLAISDQIRALYLLGADIVRLMDSQNDMAKAALAAQQGTLDQIREDAAAAARTRLKLP